MFRRQNTEDRRRTAGSRNLRQASSKSLMLPVLVLILSGCATYKFQKQEKPQAEGYVVSRDGYTMPEYTVGDQGSLPSELGQAKERFSRRRRIVEHYYKKMGHIENHFKMTIWNPLIYTAKTLKGLARLPLVAISDYRYEHNAAYRDMVDRKENEADTRQEARIGALKDQLMRRIEKDMDAERGDGAAVADKETAIAKEMAGISEAASRRVPARQDGMIRPKPRKGYSPLRVRFSCRIPKTLSGKEVSYHWDFGDGDTSTLASPVNTYYSGSFAPQDFNVTLTLRDKLGVSATATATIEVLNK